MRFPRTLFWKNNARSGAENICELDDPQQTCIIANAGEMMNNTRAKDLGVMEYLFGGGAEAQARGQRAGEADAATLSQESAQGTAAARQSQKEHELLRPLSVEERAYVENAPVAGHLITPEERQAAGQLGAEFTGPSPAEVTAAGGSYQEAADKAAQAQGLTGEPPKPEETKPPEPTPTQERFTPPPPTEPRPPVPPSGSTRPSGTEGR